MTTSTMKSSPRSPRHAFGDLVTPVFKCGADSVWIIENCQTDDARHSAVCIYTDDTAQYELGEYMAWKAEDIEPFYGTVKLERKA